MLMKFRLSLTVVFSSLVGYLLASTPPFSHIDIFCLIIGGLLITGSANTFNQILEVSYDALMARTEKRPLPTKEISPIQAMIFGFLLAALGFISLYQISPGGLKSCWFALLSILLYVLVYTPLKRYSPAAIFIGAFPGAIPILLGWVAATSDFGLESGLLFAIQFFWQIPHFIAISWVLDKEYKNAGFKMMIGGDKGAFPALVSLFSSVIMTIISVVPFFWSSNQLTLSLYPMLFIFALGIWFTLHSFKLYKSYDCVVARRLMFSSFLYLPAIQTLYVLDKIFF